MRRPGARICTARPGCSSASTSCVAAGSWYRRICRYPGWRPLCGRWPGTRPGSRFSGAAPPGEAGAFPACAYGWSRPPRPCRTAAPSPPTAPRRRSPRPGRGRSGSGYLSGSRCCSSRRRSRPRPLCLPACCGSWPYTRPRSQVFGSPGLADPAAQTTAQACSSRS